MATHARSHGLVRLRIPILRYVPDANKGDLLHTMPRWRVLKVVSEGLSIFLKDILR